MISLADAELAHTARTRLQALAKILTGMDQPVWAATVQGVAAVIGGATRPELVEACRAIVPDHGEVDRLTAALHALQGHPDFVYARSGDYDSAARWIEQGFEPNRAHADPGMPLGPGEAAWMRATC